MAVALQKTFALNSIGTRLLQVCCLRTCWRFATGLNGDRPSHIQSNPMDLVVGCHTRKGTLSTSMEETLTSIPELSSLLEAPSRPKPADPMLGALRADLS